MIQWMVLGDPAMQRAAARNPVDIRRRDPVLSGGPAELPPVEGAEDAPEIVYAEAASEAAAEPEAETQIQIAMATPVVEAAPSVVTEVSGVTPAAIEWFSAGGSYQVQLSALRSEDAAKTAWGRIQNSAPDLFQGATLDIQRADLGAKGVFFRLRVGSFADRDAAKEFCAEVKATGKDCMVVARATG
jgi:cell division septation protein DedD